MPVSHKPMWAGLSEDLLQGMYMCLPVPCRGSTPSFHLVCKQWLDSACERCTLALHPLQHQGNLAHSLYHFVGSSVKELEVSCTVTDAQLHIVLEKIPSLYSLDFTRCYGMEVSAEGLAGLKRFPHIRCLKVRADDLPSLKAVSALTHVDTLSLEYPLGPMPSTTVPRFPCADFAKLTSLELLTEMEEPPETFPYPSQLQYLMSLRITNPSGLCFDALSKLTSLKLDDFTFKSLEALTVLVDLEKLNLVGHPTDAEIQSIAKLTALRALNIKTIDCHEINCHLSSPVKLCSLPKLVSLKCDLVIFHEDPVEMTGNRTVYHAAATEDEPFFMPQWIS